MGHASAAWRRYAALRQVRRRTVNYQPLMLQERMPDHLPRVPFIHHLAAPGAAVEILTFVLANLPVEMRFEWPEFRQLCHVALSIRAPSVSATESASLA
ncbi:hypothetical protein MPLSOD_50116 [Mesorhizobium sp. SOD10]|nr:hypothetical protein MPLSOD_50116 [Mesorhizobium sp. SOD10]